MKVKTVRNWHDEAMDLAHRANFERDFVRDLEKSRILFAQALECEKEAIALVPSDNTRSEPTRSILYRSAASLALQAGFILEAIKLVSLGLGGCPPPRILSDFNDLTMQIQNQLTLPYPEEIEQELSLVKNCFQEKIERKPSEWYN